MKYSSCVIAGGVAFCTLMTGAPLHLQGWLQFYGYLPQSNRQMSTLRSAQTLSSALSEMQSFYGIPVTGVLDEETKA